MEPVSGSEFFNRLFGLPGKVAVVTGAGGVIGPHLCQGLASAGAKVAVLDLRGDVAEKVAEGIQGRGGEAIGLAVDVLDKSALVKARQAIVNSFGKVDILVNAVGANALENATLRTDQSLWDEAYETAFPKVVNLTLMGPINAIFAFSELISQSDQGGIVNITSLGARYTTTGAGPYGAAKAGLEQYTRFLAIEFGLRYKGRIRVNAIAPGGILGARNRFRMFDADGNLTERAKKTLATLPAGRPAFGEDLVSALLFLCGPASGMITGHVIPVDGGISLGNPPARE